MNFRLQLFGFKKSQYERPTQKWVCGWTFKGSACQVGPDPKGSCQATFECIPLRKGDRFLCTRSERYGGKCADGPLPDGACSKPIPKCQPTRSIRAKRTLATFWTIAFTLGMLILVGASPDRAVFFSPGDLTFAHRSALHNCAHCHAAVHKNPLQRLTATFGQAVRLEGSQLCLTCHKVGRDAFRAHGLPPDDLAVETKKAEGHPQPKSVSWSLALAMLVPEVSQRKNDELACADCHKEHNGRKFNLSTTDNHQCQTCHARLFASLANGHPEFSNFPYKRRTKIAFDHTSHIGKHFQEKYKDIAPTRCSGCHTPDRAGRYMQTRSFEITCAGCHEAQIAGKGRAGPKGIPFFRLPGLDLESLEDNGIDVGEWPADYNIEEGPTPFMKVLLLSEPTFTEDMTVLADYDDFTDLSDASEEELAAVSRIIWAIKGLMVDLASGGQETLISRLQAAIGPTLQAKDFAPLIGEIPVEVISSALKKWMPQAASEVHSHKTGRPLPHTAETEPDEEMDLDAQREKWVKVGGWYRQDLDYIVRYRPIGHADNFLRGWLDFGSRYQSKADLAPVGEIFANLSNRKAIGFCMKCHSMDSEPNQGVRINWRTKREAPPGHQFTVFAHTPHFSLLHDKECLACHILNAKADVMASFTNTNPLTFSSSFQPIQKTVCANCHTPSGDGDQCITCHRYHGETIPPVLATIPLGAALSSDSPLPNPPD